MRGGVTCASGLRCRRFWHVTGSLRWSRRCWSPPRSATNTAFSSVLAAVRSLHGTYLRRWGKKFKCLQSSDPSAAYPWPIPTPVLVLAPRRHYASSSQSRPSNYCMTHRSVIWNWDIPSFRVPKVQTKQRLFRSAARRGSGTADGASGRRTPPHRDGHEAVLPKSDSHRSMQIDDFGTYIHQNGMPSFVADATAAFRHPFSELALVGLRELG